MQPVGGQYKTPQILFQGSRYLPLNHGLGSQLLSPIQRINAHGIIYVCYFQYDVYNTCVCVCEDNLRAPVQKKNATGPIFLSNC